MIAILLLLVGADQPDESAIERFVEESKSHTVDSAKVWDAEVKAEELTLAAMKRGRIDGRPGVHIANGPRGSKVYTFQSAEVKQRQIADCEARVEASRKQVSEIKAKIRFVPATLPRSGPVIGAMGTLVDQEARVLQVVDEANLLAEVRCFMGAATRSPSGDVMELTEKQTVWISGVDTRAMLDRHVTALPQVFWVCGTKRYQTAAGGSNQVMELRAIDAEKYLTVGTLKPQEPPDAKAKPKPKTWKKAKAKKG